MRIDLECPNCRGKLEDHNNGYLCLKCEHIFGKKEGIPFLAQKQDYYWNPIAKERMEKVLLGAKDIDWKEFLVNLFKEFENDNVRSEYARMLFQESRTAWKYLTDLSQRKRALDIGCGMGGIAMNLSRTFELVCGMDLTLDRLLFVKKEAYEKHVDNIELIYGGDTEYLPFPTDYFDLVSLIGVLEWVPLNLNENTDLKRNGIIKYINMLTGTWNGKNPQKMQNNMLKEIYRILKPGGSLFLAIENRYDFHYFIKTPDTHTGLLYGSILPRPIANIYSMAIKGVNYRNYTHSYSGLKKMIERNKFESAEFYSMVPDYRVFNKIVPLNNKKEEKDKIKYENWKSYMGGKLFDSKYFCPSYGVVAKKGNKSLDAYFKKIIKYVRDNIRNDLKMGAIFVMPKGNVIINLIAANLEKNGIIIKIPIDAVAKEHNEWEMKIIKSIHNSNNLNHNLKGRVPNIIGVCNIDGQGAYLLERIEGIAATNIIHDEKSKKRIMHNALDFIVEFHNNTSRKICISEEEYGRIFGNLIYSVMHLGEGNELLFKKIDNIFRKYFHNSEIKLIHGHGDFSFNNLIVDSRNSRLSGVIDWDNAKKDQIPLIDIINLIESGYCLQGVEMGHTILKYLEGDNYSKEEKDLINKYNEILGISNDYIFPCTILYWLNHLHSQRNYPFLIYDPIWMRNNYFDVIEWMRKYL